MNQAAGTKPWFTLVGITLATLAIALTLAATQSNIGISLQLLPYLAAASLSAILLGMIGRYRREQLWLCLSCVTLGAVGFAIEHAIFSAIVTGAVIVGAFVGDVSSIDWLAEIVLGLIALIFILMFAGIGLPFILIAVAVLGALALLSDFLDFF